MEQIELQTTDREIRGKKVRSASNAINIDSAVRRPNSTVGTKLDRARIENPMMMATEFLKIFREMRMFVTLATKMPKYLLFTPQMIFL